MPETEEETILPEGIDWNQSGLELQPPIFEEALFEDENKSTTQNGQ